MHLLEKDERVLFRVIDGRPPVVALFGGQVLDQPLGCQSWLEFHRRSLLASVVRAQPQVVTLSRKANAPAQSRRIGRPWPGAGAVAPGA